MELLSMGGVICRGELEMFVKYKWKHLLRESRDGVVYSIDMKSFVKKEITG